MAGFNRVFLVGTVTDEPKLSKTQTGTQVLNIRIASENVSGSKKKGDQKVHPQYFTVVAFGDRAESVAPYVEVGKQLTIMGELQNRSYDSKKHAGEKVWVTEIVAEKIILGDKAEAEQGGRQTGGRRGGGDDDIPF